MAAFEKVSTDTRTEHFLYVPAITFNRSDMRQNFSPSGFWLGGFFYGVWSVDI